MKKIYILDENGQEKVIGEADSSLPDILIANETKKKFGNPNMKVGIRDAPDLSPQPLDNSLQPPAGLTPPPESNSNSGASLLSDALKSPWVDAAMSAAKLGLPVITGAGLAGSSPLAMGAGVAAAYAAPEFSHQLLRYIRGENVTRDDLIGSLAGTVGMGVGGAANQITPKVVQPLVQRGYSPAVQNLTALGAEFLGNTAADIAQKSIEQGTITPQVSSSDALFNAAASTLAFRPTVAQARGDILAGQLDSLVAELAKKLPGVSEDVLRPMAAVLHDNPEINKRIIELAVKDPRRIPSLVEEARQFATSAARDLSGGLDAPATQRIPISPEDLAAQSYELKTGLSEAAKRAGDSAESALRDELSQALHRPMKVTESEAVQAAQTLQNEAAKKVAKEAAAFNNATDGEIMKILQSISPGVSATDALEGTAKLGEKALSMTRSAMNAKGVLKNNAYNTLYQMLEATPSVANATVPRFNDIPRAEVLKEVRKALEMFGSPQLPGNADIRNVIRQFFPEIVDEMASGSSKAGAAGSLTYAAQGSVPQIQNKTVGDFIRSLPALNAALEAAYSMTGEKQLRDRSNALYILERLRSAVETTIDESLAPVPQLKAQWDDARALMRDYGLARSTFFALRNQGVNRVGEYLTSTKIGHLPQDEFKHIYSVIGPDAAKDLRKAETRNLLAQILHSATDPKTGTINPEKVLRKMYENENKLGDAYSLISRFLQDDRHISGEARVAALEGMLKGNLFSRIFNDMDPEVTLFAQSVNPSAVNTVKAMVYDDLLKKARTPNGGFDLNAIIKDPRVSKLLRDQSKGGMAAFPELNVIISGGGAKLAVDNAELMTKILKRHSFSNIDELFDTFLSSADISADEVKAFKNSVMQAFPGAAGEEAWANLRSTFWQRMLFHPESGSPRFDRWLNASEIGYPREFLAEMAGAGTKIYDPTTRTVKTLSEREALEKVNTWSKYIRRLQDYSNVIMTEVEGGIPRPQLEKLRMEKKIENLASFMGGTLSTALTGMYSAGASRYFLAKLAQYGILEHWNALRESRLFSSRADAFTDKLASAEKAFARVVKTMINSAVDKESGQTLTPGVQIQR